ncbi:MAG: hypothetical protein HQK77_14395 [Desulfobacterales bacterium]|nr:hypothetical protein [Desulfobacterales bacterium]
MKKRYSIPIIIYCMLFILPEMVIQPTNSYAANWTFMVYMGADNNLSEAALGDIEEMRKAFINTSVNVVVQVECSVYYSFYLPEYMPDYYTHRLHISGGKVTPVESLGNVDMGDPKSLKSFIQWAELNYPANRYALVIWDHGDGWRNKRQKITLNRGAVEDQTSGSFMSLGQLSQAVQESGVYLTVLDFDACLMGMVEVAYAFIGLTDYLVFSEEVEPGNGNPYTQILNDLSDNPSMSGRRLCSIIVDNFVNCYQGTRSSVTKSAITMEYIQELHQQLITFSGFLRSNLYPFLPVITMAKSEAQAYEYPSNIDLISFLENLSKAGGELEQHALSLINFLKTRVIIAEDHYSSTYSEGGYISENNVDKSTGLAIFFPLIDELFENEFEQYQSLSFNLTLNSWAEFLDDFLTATAGTSTTYDYGNNDEAYGLIWLDEWGFFDDADLDIYVIEPNGDIGSPWMGASTVNGYFSPDSFYSKQNYEIYTTKTKSMAGDYRVVVNYYRNGTQNKSAHAYMAYMNPSENVYYWQLLNGESMKVLSLSNITPPAWTDEVIMGIVSGRYSDWWVPNASNRMYEDFDFMKSSLLKIKAMSDSRRGKGLIQNLEKFYSSQTF